MINTQHTVARPFPLANISLVGISLAILAGVAAGADPSAAARQAYLEGRYSEAAEIYRASATEVPSDAVGLARSLRAEGKEEEAFRVLTSFPEKQADVEAELSRLAFDHGDHASARGHVEVALRLDADQLLAQWIGGELFRASGKLDEAEAAYVRIVRFYNAHQEEVRSADSLRWIGMAAARYARWNRLADQFHFLVNELYPDALKLEPGYWAAYYESGLLFLEKYNRAEAARALRSALELNPNAARVHAAIARLALVNREIDKARASLGRALEIHPRLFEAWLVKADLAWANFQRDEAVRLLEEHVLPLNPTHEQALGRLAACFLLEDRSPQNGGEGRFERLVDRVVSRNPRAGEFFFALASWLKDRNQFAEAERFFRESMNRMPQLVGPKARLGMMYMHSGAEEKAKPMLEAAFENDPFNLRVDNTLKVLGVLEEMETLATDHCVLRFDSGRDAMLARYAARYLDEIYPELCDTFGYRPPDPPLVEIFGESRGIGGQQWFSTRMVGLPYLGIVAASTGRMVGMVSPSEPGLRAQFNWAQTLRHEAVHVITLQQTNFLVPHWYTEGLAVWCEGYPRPQAWNELLVRRVPKGERFDLDSLNFAFTRPSSCDDWQMAYCQAELYVDYMLEGRSPDILRQLLAAYAENLTTAEAIRRVFHIRQKQFEEGYVEFLNRVVADLSGLKPPERQDLVELLQTQRQNPADPDLAARAARAYLRRGANQEAADLAARALAKHENHPLATYVVARLLAREGKVEKAIDLLESCLDPNSPEPNVLSLLAALNLKEEHFTRAAELYRLGGKHDPHNLNWVRRLARVYLLSKQPEPLAEILEKLALADPHDLATRKKLAKMMLAKGDSRSAAKWAKQAIEVDVLDREIHQVFAEALAERHNYLQAIEEFRAAIELEPDATATRLGLARACLEVGKKEEAGRVLEALLEVAPNHRGAIQLLEELGPARE